MRRVIPNLCVLGLALLLSSCCCKELTPPTYECGIPIDFTPDHLSGELEEVRGAPLRQEFFDSYQWSEEEYQVSIGDVLEVSVFGHEDSSLDRVIVAPDGRIYYMYFEGIPAAGRSLKEIAADIQEKSAALFVNPEVSLIPRSIAHRTYRVLGKVARPGTYPVLSTVSLREAIGEAGGIQYGGFAGTTINVANLRESFIIRDGERLAVNFEKLLYTEGSSENILVQPGDYIYIASSLIEEVFLLGEIPEAKPIPYKDGLTLVACLSGVTGIRGGLLHEADQHRITVVRGSLDNPQVITADLIQILEGRARDVYLLPGDIVYVPKKSFRFGRELVRTAIYAFFRAFGADAGFHYAEDHWFPQPSR